MHNSRLIYFVPVIVLSGISFILSCLLMSGQTGIRQSGQSFTDSLLGESRLAFSGKMYVIADMYFHKGIGRKQKEGFTGSFFQKLQKDLNAKGHHHLVEQEIDEIMPWLWIGTVLNPQNIDIFTTAAFWLSNEGNRSDLALAVLRKAKPANPYAYQLALEEGRILLKLGDKPSASQAFDAGLAFWPGRLDAESPDTRYDLAELLLYRGLLHEESGEKAQAVKCLKGILELFPARAHLAVRIEELERGITPSNLAGRIISDTLESWENKIRHKTCGSDEDDLSGHRHDENCRHGHDGH